MREILANEFVSIYGSRYSRGTSALHGFNTPFVGYALSCSECDWTRRVNGPLTEARPIGRNHALYEHGISVRLWNISQ